MRVELQKSWKTKSNTFYFCMFFMLMFLVFFRTVHNLSAEPSALVKNAKSTKNDCFIRPLSFFNQLSWNEAMDISNQYQAALLQFNSQNIRALKSENDLRLPNPPSRNEDAMVHQIGMMYSQHSTLPLSFVLLEKIDQKRTLRFPTKNKYKIFFLEDRPAFDALVKIGPTAALAAKDKIGKEPNQEKRRLMAKLIWKVLGKKFALLYLDDALNKVESDSTLSDKMKSIYKSRYSNAIDEVKKMKDK